MNAIRPGMFHQYLAIKSLNGTHFLLRSKALRHKGECYNRRGLFEAYTPSPMPPIYSRSFSSFFAFQLFRHSCSLRELSQVRGTSFSGGEGITLLPAISCKFCNPNGSCIEQSGIEPSPSGAFQHTASRQPAHRPVTQDAGSAPHDDKRPTRFVGCSLK